MDKDLATVSFYELIEIVRLLLSNVKKCLETFDYTRAYCHFLTAENAYNRAASLYFQHVTEWSPENGEQARSTLERIGGNVHGAHDVIQAGKQKGEKGAVAFESQPRIISKTVIKLD